jgi:hypothetical protein
MADAPLTPPAFVADILARPVTPAGDASGRLHVLQLTHPDYAARKASWEILLDAFEGSGGFLTGDYLWEYAREDSSDYNSRKAMARYHNYLESLVDIFVRFLWTQGVKRESENEELQAWFENVDGRGTKVDELLKQLLSVSLVHGHGGLLIDKTPEEPTGQTQADDRGQIIASVFTALAIPDWRIGRHGLEAVKLFEPAPPPPITEAIEAGEDALQYLLMDREGFARFDSEGNLVSAGTPNLGLVPLVILRPKPSYISAMTGRALVNNANIIRALFNRASEEDEVIRAQAFSVLTVSVPQDGNVDDAKASLGSTIGTAKALVVKGDIKYATPDQSVAGTIRENIAYLVQELYRAAHVRISRDSAAAESAEAIRLQHTELNEMLQGLAKSLQAAERAMVRAWFAWATPTYEQAERAFEQSGFEATYPTEFFVGSLMEDLEAWAEAVRLDLGESMARRIKRRAVRRIDPDIPAAELAVIDEEIEAMGADDLNPPPPDMGVVVEPVNGEVDDDAA